MDAQVSKWGNSYALRIPAALAKSLNVTEGSKVELAVENGALVARPVSGCVRYALNDLLGRITPDNIHAETSTGPALENEF